jgi:two-component system nitrate/nitrite response regulator NarL
MRSTRLVIADRHPVVLQGLSSALEVQNGLKIVACCSDGLGCIEAIRKLTPDIAILDISMPGLTGLEILSIANAEGLSTRLVFFTAAVTDREVVMSAAAGAYGVILKHVALEVLVQSLWQVARGHRLPLPSTYRAASHEPEQRNIAETVLAALTERERQIMRLVSEGLSNKEIGRRLNIADGTIKVHLHHVYRKLEISNRTVLAALAISQK